ARDERMRAALAVLPKTLCHGDPNRANVLGTALVDWGNARVAPAGLDLAVLAAQGPVDLAAYRAEFSALPEPLALVEREWALVQAHVQYLGFAADHLGSDRVAEMTGTATAALDRLGPALDAL
ncbi:phosphotransferase family protein, partial [Pseudonocardia pini]|uniref:phosphotransferase family protein n=1 Tax=Pseudonocardia pini TaxID=2758030 RepID=UPI0015F04773